jgi:hypothetical protein
MCRIDGGERAEVYVAKIRKAAKAHKCYECRRQINTGERYHNAKVIYEGQPDEFKTCAHCTVGVAWLKHNCGGYMFGDVMEDIREHADEYPAIAKPIMDYVARMRRQWQRADGRGLLAAPRPIPDIRFVKAPPAASPARAGA